MRIAIKYFFKSISNYHKQGDKNNIYLFSTPRSGSTWLLEIIASQPGLKYYDEPLNLRRDNVKKTGIFDSWEDLMHGTNNEDLIISYFKKLESNELKFMNPPPFRRNHRLFTTRIIFKIHEIEHMINYIKNRLNADIILLLRHPVATTISRYELPRLEFFLRSKYFQERYLTEYQTNYIHELYGKGTEFERGILSWCFQNLIPLNFSDKNDWTIISYEELVLNSYKSCELLYERLRLSNLKKLLRQAGEPAFNMALSTKETIDILNNTSEERRKKKLVTKWKDKVSEENELRAFEILSAFNIDAYVKDRFIPNRKYLNFDDTEGMLL